MTVDGTGNGGRRAGAGRPKGAMAKRTFRYLGSLREKYTLLPLEHMLEVLNDQNASPERRDAAAKCAAPYFHPRLSVVLLEEKEMKTCSIDFDKLTDDELITLEHLISKSQMPIDENADDEEFPPTT